MTVYIHALYVFGLPTLVAIVFLLILIKSGFFFQKSWSYEGGEACDHAKMDFFFKSGILLTLFRPRGGTKMPYPAYFY